MKQIGEAGEGLKTCKNDRAVLNPLVEVFVASEKRVITTFKIFNREFLIHLLGIFDALPSTFPLRQSST